MGKREEDKDMAAVLNFKKKIKPALNREEFVDMFFDKRKREATYKKFDEKQLEIEEDNLVDLMKKRIKFLE
ncbi:hypothetical protein ACYCSU_16455 [Paenibacillus sp. ALE1]